MTEPEPSIFNLSPEDAGVFHWNVDENLFCADAHFAEIFGLNEQDVLDGLPIETYLAAVWEGDRRSVARTLHHAISTGGSCFQDYHVVRPDGSMVHVVGIGRCFRNIRGEATRYVGVLFDDVELNDDQKRDMLAGYCRVAAEVAFELKQDTVGSLLVDALNSLEDIDDETKERDVVHH